MAEKPAKVESQIDKFREAARQLETDDNEARFNERLGKLAKAPPAKDHKSDDSKPAK
ncbi:hypothetical protein [Rhizobium rhizoryzae]|uniref:Uncharacterized protein n=1 Tax=Rhizobium rhizoryzae TaxID=451876 RepID=A0A7W6LEG3_9HYPH|nr:hypothetical protein [Rhizobium rhizoryzae]MBB4142731.1 hypothetical protein [Rhizobium rhizoryzae]